MQIDKARRISTAARDAMSADALVLVYDASAKLGRQVVIDVIAAVLDSIGDPLEKLWIENASAGRRTYDIAEAAPVLSDPTGCRYLWAIPRSERRNSKSRWLTAAMIDNVAVDTSILFFASPRSTAPEFMAHRRLLESLVRAGITPQYGYGSTCQYDKPGYFAFDYAYNSRVPTIAHADWARACALSDARVGQQARSPILDVFPLNVLSDAHLRQRVGASSFKEWIVLNTGSNSLAQIGPGCSAWFAPRARAAQLSTQLKAFGLTLDQNRQPTPAVRTAAVARRALRAASAAVCVDPARCDPAPTRFHNQTAPVADRPGLPPRRADAPAASGRASPVSLSRRPG
jgi:hypothetical protein